MKNSKSKLLVLVSSCLVIVCIYFSGLLLDYMDDKDAELKRNADSLIKYKGVITKVGKEYSSIGSSLLLSSTSYTLKINSL